MWTGPEAPPTRFLKKGSLDKIRVEARDSQPSGNPRKMNLTKKCCPPSKIMLPLHSWRLSSPHIPYWVHLKSKIQHICLLTLSKWTIDWHFIPEVKPWIIYVINLEVKDMKKSSWTHEVVSFWSYHLKGFLSFKIWAQNSVLILSTLINVFL